MTAVFEELQGDGRFRALAGELAARPVSQRWAPGPEDAVVLAPSEPVEFDAMVSLTDNRKFTDSLVKALHELELERAAQPPVIHLTVPATTENGLVPGEYQVRTGPHPTLSLNATPPSDDTSHDIPVYRDRRRGGRLTSRLARRLRAGF